MRITKREVILSVAIAAVLLIVGFFISGKISDRQNDKNAEYQKAIHIQDTDMFRYGMDTNAGNAFVYGELSAVEPVTYPEIGGEYMAVEKVKERYTMHTRTYTTTDGKGHTQTHTQHYWTWDNVGQEEIQCEEITFCGVKFPSNKIYLPGAEYIDTIKKSSSIRYKYYAVLPEYTGTIYTNLSDNTISDYSDFYENRTIDEALKICTSSVWLTVFWIFWVILISGAVIGFCYFENDWLEDRKSYG